MKKLCLAVGFIAVLSAILVIAVTPRVSRLSEPEYHGRKLTAWLEDSSVRIPPPGWTPILASDDPATAIREIGTNGVPFLVQMLHAKDSPFKRKCMHLLSRQHWVKFHILYDFQKRNLALRGLAILGPDAKAAIPDLANLVSKNDLPGNLDMAIFVLSQIGPASVPVLVNALNSTNKFVRWPVAQALARVADPSCLSSLLAALKNPDPDTRISVTMALHRFAGQANVIIPALTNCLDDPNDVVRGGVAGALGSFGPDAEPAFPKLLTMVADTNYQVSEPATLALMRIDFDRTLVAFTNNLESPDVKVRRTTAWALMLLKSDGEPAVPFLVKCLKDPDPTVRKNAAVALREIAADPDLVVPTLIANLNDTNAEVREVTAIALRSFGERAKPAVPQILKIIEENKAMTLILKLFTTPLTPLTRKLRQS
jgi:HEAT repeat protein